VSLLQTRQFERVVRRDPELIRGIADGDLACLGELYDRYAQDVWRAVSRSLGDSADIEDVVHTTFLSLPRIAHSYDGRAECAAWLYGIAVRLALRHGRGAGRFRRMLQSFAEVAPRRATSDPERRASHLEDAAIFARALEGLSAKKRAVFVLVELEELSSDEAAKALEIPAATVRTRLLHARRELHAALERETAHEPGRDGHDGVTERPRSAAMTRP
jgi:RNA polymerase sigma-70 factor (ECF subfamily)